MDCLKVQENALHASCQNLYEQIDIPMQNKNLKSICLNIAKSE